MAENENNRVVAHVGFEVDNEASSLDKIVKQIEKINSTSKSLADSFSKFEDAFKKINSIVKDENGNIISTSQKTKTQLNEEAKQTTANAKAQSKERIAVSDAEAEKIKQAEKRKTEFIAENNKKALEALKAENKATTFALNEEEKRRTASHNAELKMQLIDQKEAISSKKQGDKEYTSWWNSELKQQETYTKESYSRMVTNAKNAYSQMSTAVNSLSGLSNKNSSFDNAQTRNQLGYAVANATLTVTGVRAVLNEFSNISSQVVEIEKNAIDAQRIMGDTSKVSVDVLTKYAIQTAKATDTQVTDVQEIQNAWIRINDQYANNVDLLNKITDATAKFVNVGEIKDADDAVRLLNASILQFSMYTADGSVNIDEALKTLDKWAYMADKTALGTADEFGESISKIGGYVTSLGGNMDDAIVLTSILGDRLAKTGDEAGNSLKTITAYLTRDKTISLFEKLSLDSDGLSRSLMKTDTQFEEFQVIMDKVSKAYNDALASGDEVTAKAIQNAIGATRQGDSAIALLKNWAEDSQKYYGMIDEATKTSYLDKQNEALMESFQAQWNSLKVSMVEFGNAFAKSGIIDGLSGIMGAFGNLLDMLSDLNPATLETITTFTTLSVAFAGLNKIAKLTGIYDVFTTAVKYGTVAQRQNAESVANATKEFLRNELAVKQGKVASDAYTSASMAEKVAMDNSVSSLLNKTVEFERLTLQYKNGQINAEQYAVAVKALNIQESAENVTTAQGTVLNNAENISKGTATATTAGLTIATRAQTTAQSILNGVMAVGSAVLKTLLSPMTLVTAGITLLIALFSSLKSNTDEANKSIENSVSAYDKAKTELDGINQELDKTGQKIDELNGKDSLSFIEKGELEDLKETNRLLTIQQGIQEAIAETARKKVEQTVIDSYNSDYADRNKVGYVDNHSVKISGEEDLLNSIEAYDKLNKKQEQGIELTKAEKKQYDFLKQSIGDAGTAFNKYLDNYDTDDDFRKHLEDMSEAILKVINPEEYKTLKFTDVFDSEDFKDAKDQLVALAQAGKLDESVIDGTKKYNDTIKITAKTAEDVVNQVRDLGDATSDETKKILASYDDIIKKRKELGSKMVGNVDINNRPVVLNGDDSYSTSRTGSATLWQGDDNGQDVIVHYTPILPDGTVLTDEALDKYLNEQLNDSLDILNADKKENGGLGIVYKVDTEVDIDKANQWDEDMHNIQDDLYHQQAENAQKLVELSSKGEISNDVLTSNSKFSDLLSKTGLNAKEVVDQIIAYTLGLGKLKEEQQEQPEETNIFGTTDEVLDDFQKKMKAIKATLDGLDGIDSASLIDLMQQFGDFDWGSYGVTGAVDETGKAVGDLEGALKGLSKQEYESLDANLQNNEAIKELYENSSVATKEVMSFSDALGEINKNANVINDVQAEYKELGRISTDSLQSIIKQYPELEGVVQQFMSGLISEKELILSMNEAYQTDLGNYNSVIQAKVETENSFWKTIYGTLNGQLGDRANLYLQDLENANNVTEAKAKLEQELINSSSKAWNKYYTYMTKLNAGIDNGADEIRTEKLAQMLLDKNPDLQAWNDVYVGITKATADVVTSISSSLSNPASTGKVEKPKKEKTEFSDSINFAEQSLKSLQNAVDDAQEELSNAKGYDEQIKAIDKLTKAQEALKKGYQETADMYKDKYNSVKGIDKYKTMIESGQSFTIKDFTNEKTFDAVSQAQDYFNSWQDSLKSVNDTTQDILGNYDKINSTLTSMTSDFEDLQGTIVKALKAQYKEQYDERVKYLKKENDAQVKAHNERIKQLQAEIDKINGNTPADKNTKLNDLKTQLGLWNADTSTLGKSKQKELQDQITALDKEIKIDSINKQIDMEEKAVDDINTKFDNLLDSDSEFYDSALKKFDEKMTDQELYSEANAMINNNNQQKIIDLITRYAPDYSGIATLMGNTAGQIIADKISSVMSGLDILKNGVGSSESSTSNSNGLSATGDFKAKSTAKTTTPTVNSTSNIPTVADITSNVKGKASSNANASSVASVALDSIGKSITNSLSLLDLAKKNGVTFKTGGETGNNEGLGYLHKKERILDQQQTNAFDNLVYNFLPEISEQLSGGTISKSDITNNSTTFNKELVSVTVGTIVNNTPYDIKNSEDNLNRTITKGLQKAGMSTKL